VYISPYCRLVRVPPIFMKFGVRDCLTDIIMFFKFLVDRFTGYGVLIPQNCHFPLTCCVALTTVYALPCDTVILNGTTFNDLERPLTRISRSRHFWCWISEKRRVLKTKLLYHTGRKLYLTYVWQVLGSIHVTVVTHRPTVVSYKIADGLFHDGWV